jgi:hypothetical protein
MRREREFDQAAERALIARWKRFQQALPASTSIRRPSRDARGVVR